MSGNKIRDVAFSLTADSGELEWQSIRLVRSIRSVYEDASLVVFIPESGWNEMSAESRRAFNTETTVVKGEIPVPEYPISAMIQAMVEASERVDAKYIIGLDTDVLLLNEIELPSGNGNIWLRPAEVGAKYWCSQDATTDWQVLFSEFGVDYPSEKVTTTVDKKRVLPFYNSGVVVTTDYSLPREWLDITTRLVRDELLPVKSDEFFIDQIALAIAVQSRHVVVCGEILNYPLGGRVRTPPDICMLHYGDTRNLGRILNSRVRKQLESFDALPPVSVRDSILSGLVVASSHSGRLVSYQTKKMVRSAVIRVLSDI